MFDAASAPMPENSLSAVDLFSGCGGLSLGLQLAGFRVLSAIENESVAAETYALNHPSTYLVEKDIQTVSATCLREHLGLMRGDLDLLAGCPPCQGFSKLWTLNGNHMSDHPQNNLVLQFQKFVRVFLPKAVMLENVPGLISDRRHDQFVTFLHQFGYAVESRICDAADYGVPQRRHRMLLIALLDHPPRFSEKSSRRISVKEAIGHLHKPGTGDDPLHDYKVSRSPAVQNRISQIPKDGGSRSQLPIKAQLACHRKQNGFKDVYGRMKWSNVSPTITGGCTNPSKGRFLHPAQDRAITLREAALLQGFPESYKFALTRGRCHTAQIIGNAFPPKFAGSHAREIAQLLNAACCANGKYKHRQTK